MSIDLAKLVKGAATSRTLYGGASLFAMLVGNVRIKFDIWIFDHLYHFEDASLIAAAFGLAFVIWGRCEATGPLVVDKQPQPAAEAEPKGFPRA